MSPAPNKKEPKNPARVDAALKTHLRRMEAAARRRVLWVAAFALSFVLLLTFQPMRPNRTSVCAAFSAVACLFAVIGVLDAVSRQRQTRGKLLRTCRGCGYDLRATPDVCPECGTPIPDGLRAAREVGKDKLYMGELPPE